MISRITGTLTRLTGLDAFVEVGAIEYHIYVPEFVRRQLQSHLNQPVSLRTIRWMPAESATSACAKPLWTR